MGDVRSGPWKPNEHTPHVVQPAQLQYLEMAVANLAGNLNQVIQYAQALDAKIQALEHRVPPR
jgi:hypothetical protein